MNQTTNQTTANNSGQYLGSHKRMSTCPECFQEHPVMEYENDWQNAVRDKLAHLTRGDGAEGTGGNEERPLTSHAYEQGVKFAKLVMKTPAWRESAREIYAELLEQRVYHKAVQGYHSGMYAHERGRDAMAEEALDDISTVDTVFIKALNDAQDELAARIEQDEQDEQDGLAQVGDTDDV